jgi:hypothetical protein
MVHHHFVGYVRFPLFSYVELIWAEHWESGSQAIEKNIASLALRALLTLTMRKECTR